MPDLIGEIRKVDKTLMKPKRELCVWCGANLKAWAEELGEGHTSKICNWKEKEVIDLLHEFGCGYEPENPSISDTSIQVRDYAFRIAKVIKEG